MIGENGLGDKVSASESSKLALKYCFNELGLEKIYLGVIAETKER